MNFMVITNQKHTKNTQKNKGKGNPSKHQRNRQSKNIEIERRKEQEKTIQSPLYALYIHLLMEPTYLGTTDIPASTRSKERSSFSSGFFTVSVNETNFQLPNQNPGAVFSSPLSHSVPITEIINSQAHLPNIFAPSSPSYAHSLGQPAVDLPGQLGGPNQSPWAWDIVPSKLSST